MKDVVGSTSEEVRMIKAIPLPPGAAVARPRMLTRPAVAHLDQKLDDEPFEKCEILHQYDIQQFGRQFIVYLFVGVGDRFFRIDSRRALVFPRLVVAGRRGVEIDEIRVSRQVGYVYFLFGF